MKKLQLLLGVGISALFLWRALGGLQLGAVWQDIRGANYWWLIPSVLTYFVAVWARTWRWDYMLRPLNPRVADLMHFYAHVMTHDCVAESFGQRSLANHFRAKAQASIKALPAASNN